MPEPGLRIRPAYLKKGDTIGVAAPCACFDPDRLNRGVEAIEAMGFKVKVPRGIFDTCRYLAGQDKARAKVLIDLFADPEVKAVICARGGFGAMRILPYLDLDLIQNQPTWVIGFSDATALISCLVSRAGMAAIHGPNAVSLAEAGAETLNGFELAVTGNLTTISLDPQKSLVEGEARGRLVGGNLATLAHLLGTSFQPVFDQGILFIEDIGEPAYKIDRMLSQMKMAGLFDHIRGVVTGSFENCENAFYIPEILMEIFPGLPLIMGMPAGHGTVNLAFPMGGEARLDTRSALLTLERG